MSDLTDNPARVIKIMRADRKHELYEAGDPATNMKTGNGEWHLTYRSGEGFAPLTRTDINHLLSLNLIEEANPDVYRLRLSRAKA
jgi:hypothetical protein